MKTPRLFLLLSITTILLPSFSSNRNVSRSHEQNLFYGFMGGLVEYIPKMGVEFHSNSLVFKGGMEIKRISQTTINTLFPDSTYPLPPIYANDSAVEEMIGLPVGRKRYFVTRVKTVISGEGGMMLESSSKEGDYTFLFSSTGKSKSGVVRIVDTNIYFINP